MITTRAMQCKTALARTELSTSTNGSARPGTAPRARF